jgi:hypothetical protein
MAAMSHWRARAAPALGPKSRVLVFGAERNTDPAVRRDVVGMDGDAVRAAAR